MRRTLALLALLAILAPAVALGQRLSFGGKFLCSDRTSGSTPLITFNEATQEWCPRAIIDDAAEVRGDAGAAGTATLSTAELTVVDGDELGCLHFQAPLESSGTDAILVGAAICGEADSTFSASDNTTDIVFKVGTSAAAAEVMRLLSTGLLQFVSKTADPCSAGAEGSIFWNDTSNYFCYCDGTNDLKMNDNTTACF